MAVFAICYAKSHATDAYPWKLYTASSRQELATVDAVDFIIGYAKPEEAVSHLRDLLLAEEDRLRQAGEYPPPFCSACEGRGMLFRDREATRSANEFIEAPIGYKLVKRCTVCKRFKTDMEAAESLNWPDPCVLYDRLADPHVMVLDNR